MADPIEVAKDGVEKFNAGDWSGLRSTLTSDTVEDEFATQRRLEGPEAVVAAAEGWKRAFPMPTGRFGARRPAATRPSWRSSGRALRPETW
jgi:hypothetical protein